MYEDFKIGDVVILNEDYCGFKKGTIGVIDFTDGDPNLAMRICCINTNEGGYIKGVFAKRLRRYEKCDELHITTRGNKIIVVYKHDGKIEKAVAKCSPEYEFDLKIGAKIALERLGFVVADPVSEVTAEKPMELRMSETNSHLGICGTPTKYKDVYGTPLFVGDVVEHMRDNKLLGETVICEDNDYQFVMGIKCYCEHNTGETGHWTIIKKKSYTEMKRGDSVFKDHVKYV